MAIEDPYASVGEAKRKTCVPCYQVKVKGHDFVLVGFAYRRARIARDRRPRYPRMNASPSPPIVTCTCWLLDQRLLQADTKPSLAPLVRPLSLLSPPFAQRGAIRPFATARAGSKRWVLTTRRR